MNWLLSGNPGRMISAPSVPLPILVNTAFLINGNETMTEVQFDDSLLASLEGKVAIVTGTTTLGRVG